MRQCFNDLPVPVATEPSASAEIRQAHPRVPFDHLDLRGEAACSFSLGDLGSGVPLVEESRDPDFLRQQVLTARNVRSHPLTDFWYGGLNFQIEHHLFPSMPRNRLAKAKPLVEKFCKERDISYHETSPVGSYVEIFQHLKRTSEPVRNPTP